MAQWINIWIDGVCKGNPGPGGWGVLIHREDGPVELSGSEGSTTNNRVELLALIKALEYFESGVSMVIHTDSEYLERGVNTWMDAWRRRGWKTSHGTPVQDMDMWKSIHELVKNNTVRVVRSRKCDAGCRLADSLASVAAVYPAS